MLWNFLDPHVTLLLLGENSLFILRIIWNTVMHFLGKTQGFGLSTHLIHAVAYRSVAKQWLCKQRPFLGNGSVNTFRLLGSRFLIMQQLDYNNGTGMFSMWSVPRCCKQRAKLSVELSFVRGASKIPPKRVTLKNFHC
jgi:hypothetical protein